MKIPKFSLKTYKEANYTPPGTTQLQGDYCWSILMDLMAKNIFWGDLLRFKHSNLFSQLKQNGRSYNQNFWFQSVCIHGRRSWGGQNRISIFWSVPPLAGWLGEPHLSVMFVCHLFSSSWDWMAFSVLFFKLKCSLEKRCSDCHIKKRHKRYVLKTTYNFFRLM